LNCFKEIRAGGRQDGRHCSLEAGMPQTKQTPTDLRGLEPPQPLVRILDFLEKADAGPHAFLLERAPRPLYPLLAAAGWRHTVHHREDGVELVVSRAAGQRPGKL